MQVTYHQAAVDELIEAAVYYEGKRAGLGVEFLAEVDRVVTTIAESPELFAVVRNETRRALLKRFPYGIYFRLVNGMARILVVQHHRRNPEYGVERR